MVEEVSDFKYLGSNLTPNSQTIDKIPVWIVAAKDLFRLKKPLKSRKIGLKKKFTSGLIHRILLYIAVI